MREKELITKITKAVCSEVLPALDKSFGDYWVRDGEYEDLTDEEIIDLLEANGYMGKHNAGQVHT